MRRAARRPSYDQTALSPLEKTIAAIWAKQLQIPVRTIAPEDNYFDLGGDSLKVQHILSSLRKELSGTSVPPPVLFQHPTLRGFVGELEKLIDPIGLNLESMTGGEEEPKQNEYYSKDRTLLSSNLPQTFPAPYSKSSAQKTVLITGATGFLGAHIVDLLVQDKARVAKIIVHVRASDIKAGLERMRNTCLAYGLQLDERVSCVIGDLAQPKLGLSANVWEAVSKVSLPPRSMM